MYIPNPVPILIFTGIALVFLLFSRRAGGLKAILVSSYCGVIITSFTGGSSGAIWLGPLFVFIVGLILIWRHKEHVFGARATVRFANALFIIFIIGIFIGLMRYDPSLEFIKAGRYRTLLGIPVQFLMALYRFQIVTSLFLAFALPQRYYVDRRLFVECLVLSWLFTLVLSIMGILAYAGVPHLDFRYGVALGVYGRQGVLGFLRGGNGLILVSGIFMSFALSQLTRNHLLKILVYCSLPVLVISLFFTFSRAAMLAIIIGGMSLAVTLGGARAFKGILVCLFIAIVLFITFRQLPEVSQRFFSFPEELSVETLPGGKRVVEWIRLTKWLFESPGVLMVGTGFQNFHYFIQQSPQTIIIMLEAGHNSYLHILTELGIVGLFVFLGWVASIFFWLVSWRHIIIDKVDRMMPGIFISLMLAIMASCLTQESLAPSSSMVPWLVHFYIILGIWISYYRTQMMELNELCEVECMDYDNLEMENFCYS